MKPASLPWRQSLYHETIVVAMKPALKCSIYTWNGKAWCNIQVQHILSRSCSSHGTQTTLGEITPSNIHCSPGSVGGKLQMLEGRGKKDWTRYRMHRIKWCMLRKIINQGSNPWPLDMTEHFMPLRCFRWYSHQWLLFPDKLPTP